MMLTSLRTVLLSICLLTALRAQAQLLSANALNIGQTLTLRSTALLENRTLNVYLPQTYDPAKAYPVIYVLDGSMNEDFLHVAGLVQYFNMTFGMPEHIVVGIANVDRRRDFTAKTESAELRRDYPTVGHSEAFIRFLEKEVQPLIAKTYKTTGSRYLIGQSLGGLLATEILLTKPSLFTHYLIVSPSLWWDNEALFRSAPERLRKTAPAAQFVYVSVGAEGAQMIADDEKLVGLLRDAKQPGLRVEYVPMMKENHATILHLSLYEAFKLLYPYKD